MSAQVLPASSPREAVEAEPAPGGPLFSPTRRCEGSAWLAVSSVRVLAQRDDGAVACFVVANPPTAQDTERIALLAALPGLSTATWTTEPGESSR